jgi:hypothetical protein
VRFSYANHNSQSFIPTIVTTTESACFQASSISFPKQMRDVPTTVGCESQQEHEPPEHKYGSHPDLVFGNAEFLRQKARARSQQDVQSRDFGYGSERGVRRRKPVVGFAKFERYLRTHMNAKRRNHCENDRAKVQEHDYGLAPSVLPNMTEARQQRAYEQTHSYGNLKEQSDVGIGRCRRS